MESVVKRNIAFDYLRVAACALVIGVHVSGLDWEVIVNSGSAIASFPVLYIFLFSELRFLFLL